ncbi:MAG TPA: leucyl aminopeptidase [Firmicutes bacterium]|nr:leucyl aminopeptidase [Candidatus Fermentithermobacillaceae bacterium]
MKEMAMARGAKTLVETCAGIEHGENVIVVVDYSMMGIGQVIASMAYALGAKTDLIVASPREFDGQEPSDPVAAALSNCDVFFTAVDRSLTHTNSVADALRQGARGIGLTHFTEEMLISGGIDADFRGLAPRAKEVTSAIENASVIHLTTPAGTNLTMSSKGRLGNAYTCLVVPGEFCPVPNVEANVAPLEGTSEGVIVVDGSIPYEGIGLIREPITIKVSNGMLGEITGGFQAKQLAEALEQQDDPKAYNLAELGIGLNPQCKFIGVMLEDQGVYGTVHIGTGTNITLGGNIKARSHYDLIMKKPTLVVDGRRIITSGELCI